MDRLFSIGEASEMLGVSITTLRRWETEGKLVPKRTVAGHRRYDLAKLKPELFRAALDERHTVAYARVSSHDQKNDLERQKQVLELYCAKQGWTFEVIADLGSGMNYHKKGLKRLLVKEGDSRTNWPNFLRDCMVVGLAKIKSCWKV